MTPSIRLVVGTDHAVPIEPQGGQAVVTVDAGSGPVYYGDSLPVNATTNQGSIAAGGSQTFIENVWLWAASASGVLVAVTSVYDEWAGVAPDATNRFLPANLATTTIGAGPQAVSGSVMTVAGVPITNPYGLRRWRAALADALNADANIVCVGDSHTFGQNADGVMAGDASHSAADAPLCFVGQLRSLFAVTYGDPGEGFWFPHPTFEGRVAQVNASGLFNAPGQAPGAMKVNIKLTSVTATLTVTTPANATRLIIVQANQSGDTSSTWSLNGSNQGSISTLTGTGVPIATTLTVVGGQPVVVTGHNATTDTIISFTWRTAQTKGVPVHRVGSSGQTQWQMMGGEFNGVVGTPDGSAFYTTPQQQANIRACYAQCATPGLLMIRFGTNEQSLQLGSAGQNNAITPTLFKQGVQLAVNTAVSDGWCVLLVSPCPSGSENQSAGASSLTAYATQLAAIAASTDHCAMIDIADLWGGNTTAGKAAAFAAGLRDQFSSHPTRKGYGDDARLLHRVLDRFVAVGN